MPSRNRILAAVGGVAVMAGTIGGVAACSSGPSGPPNATQVLQANGYTPDAAYTQSLQGGIGNDSEVTSSQAGTNSAGDIEGVVVFDSQADAQAGASSLQGAYGGDGLAIGVSGDVLTVSGPLSTWASIAG